MIPIVGNICRPNLGMDPRSSATLMEQVNVVVSSAAITHDDRLVLILFNYFLKNFSMSF